MSGDVHLRRTAGFQLLEQRRQRGNGAGDHRENFRAARDGAVDQLIEQPLAGPGVLADAIGAHHAAAALERVEGAAQARERVAIGVVLFPRREAATDIGDLLARLLDEGFEQIRIEPLGSAAEHLRRLRAGRMHQRQHMRGFRLSLWRDVDCVSSDLTDTVGVAMVSA